MRISNGSFLSIKHLNDTQMPNFVLLTGPNGVGKSHLLQGIVRGKFLVDQEDFMMRPSFEGDILFTQAEFPPKSWSNELSQIGPERIDQFYKCIRNAESTALAAIGRKLRDIGSPLEADAVLKLPTSEVEELLMPTFGWEQVLQIRTEYNQLLWSQLTEEQRNAGGDIDSFPEIPAEPLRYSQDELIQYLRPQVGIMNPELAELFNSYRTRWQVSAMHFFRYNRGDYAAFRADFVGKNGLAPWDELDQLFSAVGLPFRFMQQSDDITRRHDLRLERLRNVEGMKPIPANRLRRAREAALGNVDVTELSSGEKVIISLIVSQYVAQKQFRRTPRLLLFDEVDAPLHPSLARVYLNVLEKVFVEKRDMRIIATTHSPSTVALAPEGCVHVLEIVGDQHQIRQVSKDEAIASLTVEVPTLSIDYSGRRQVFVESENDARNYALLYQRLRGRLRPGRSLSFIGVGGSAGGGCELVRRIVSELTLNGNRTVFGLVDWDGRAEALDRVLVASPGIRNGIENLLFDPLLLIAVLNRTNPRQLEHIGLPTDLSVDGLKGLEADSLREAVVKLAALVLGERDFSSTIEIEYLGGHTIPVPTAYLHEDDHDLARAIHARFPFLQRMTQKDVLGFMANDLLRDYVDFLPVDCLRTFEQLLEFE